MAQKSLTSITNRIIGYLKGWFDALLIALKLKKAQIKDDTQ